MLKQATFIYVSLIISAVVSPAEDNLRMRDGAPFKIALFADLHFGEDAWTQWGPRQDFNSLRVMSSVLDKEHPGLKLLLLLPFMDTLLDNDITLFILFTYA